MSIPTNAIGDPVQEFLSKHFLGDDLLSPVARLKDLTDRPWKRHHLNILYWPAGHSIINFDPWDENHPERLNLEVQEEYTVIGCPIPSIDHRWMLFIVGHEGWIFSEGLVVPEPYDLYG